MKTLIIDNYDSFTYNLFQYLGELGANPVVKRNDEVTYEEILALEPTHIVISPGPGHPAKERDFGVCAEVIEKTEVPLLGVCLGHQGMVHVLGGKVVQAPEIMHGKQSLVEHDGKGVFAQLPDPLTVMRYHSLMAEEESMPDCFEVTARTTDGLIMGIRHKTRPMVGIQFHPESIGSPEGKQLLANFLQG